jgi:ABC-type sugar transport system permease subunit
MLAPMTLVLLLVVGYPLVDAPCGQPAPCQSGTSRAGQPFIGLGNYLYAFGHMAFWHAFRTLYFIECLGRLELAPSGCCLPYCNERFRQSGARLALLFPWGLLTISNGVLWPGSQPDLWCGQYPAGWSGSLAGPQSLVE